MLLCEMSFTMNETHITILSNGIPNHDFHSGPGCCVSEQNYDWIIPLEPVNQTGCNPSISIDGCTLAPDRGPVVMSVNGVPMYGPEDGPGSDAVSMHEGNFEEDRQQIWLGVCHAHSAGGGTYHYHGDANCVHWHPDAEKNETWLDYSIDSSRQVSEHSPISGFAFDGYPVYGFVGWDENGEPKEMTSSYRLKDGETGYNGKDDYEYITGLGDLDACNGIFSPTPDYPDGIYHYHSTWWVGDNIGFPYFINCYRGETNLEDNADAGQGGGGDDPDCSGHGETWGPGIGPPPPGCGNGPPPGGDQSVGNGIIAIPWLKSLPPNSGLILLSMLVMASMTRFAFKESAFDSNAQGQADRVREYRSALARA
ncbi:MAG: YHYH protein [Euryarchaeota archaeon]|jgi:hypothetical protein|nr:YHYH protein [Euryarchaeota archaeon]MBT3653766.1 YHYH protein [Euryarchaeota archaeon]MBT4962282.1 YHYH protein [Euryarchaeota archaeon]MBT5280495.1 YHYH protein [Euryarchaeota archaeon]MBT5509364.1 YHYH protein [Euryarchaeota archaeon]